MKTINEDTEGFFDQGGWSFLDPESDVRRFTPSHPHTRSLSHTHTHTHTHTHMHMYT